LQRVDGRLRAAQGWAAICGVRCIQQPCLGALEFIVGQLAALVQVGQALQFFAEGHGGSPHRRMSMSSM